MPMIAPRADRSAVNPENERSLFSRRRADRVHEQALDLATVAALAPDALDLPHRDLRELGLGDVRELPRLGVARARVDDDDLRRTLERREERVDPFSVGARTEIAERAAG